MRRVRKKMVVLKGGGQGREPIVARFWHKRKETSVSTKKGEDVGKTLTHLFRLERPAEKNGWES